MKLTSNATFWQKRSGPSEDFPPLGEDLSCDTAIVGGGVVGALFAYQLSRRGFSVVLLDKRQPGQGSTSASTGLLLYELDAHLADLAERMGPEKASRIYRLSFESLRMVRRIAENLGAPTGFRPKRSLYAAFEENDAGALERDYQLRRDAGFRVRLLSKDDLLRLFHIDARAALLTEDAADIDPYLFTKSLHAEAHTHGARIFGDTEVTRLHSKKGGCRVETAGGATVSARTVIMATGYESHGLLRTKLADLKSSYVVVSKPVSGLAEHWLKDHLFWETARPYLYVRSTPDGRIMVGGEDVDIVDPAVRDALIGEKTERLIRRFRSLVPDLPFVMENSWAGTFAETPDGVGYIGSPRGWPNVYFVLGFGGNGITFAVLATELLTKLLRGEPAPDADLFSFGR